MKRFGAARSWWFVAASLPLFSCACRCRESQERMHQQTAQRPSGPNWEALRRRMVETQIRARRVRDPRVLAAMLQVPRHLFVPEAWRAEAYSDRPLPIGLGQTISQPYIVAYMTEALEPGPRDRVLEIGTGSGYQAAVLSRIVAHVYTIEILPELSRRAQRVLSKLGYDNISFRIGDGYAGWPEEAPFDGIILTAAPPRLPRPLLEQLRVGGRLVAPVGRGSQVLIRVRRTERGYETERLLPVRFVPMVGRAEGSAGARP